MPNLPTSPANPNALPDGWIEHLFRRFSTMYGKHWLDMWADVPIAMVQETWREDLAFASADQLRKALSHCRMHNKFPPTCPEFVGLCKAFAPAIENGALSLPAIRYGDIDPGVRQAIADALTKGKDKDDPKDWARNILKEYAEGTYRHHYGVQCAKRALGLIQ